MKAVGYPTNKGLAGICIRVLSPIMCENAVEDPRFYPPLDDPEGELAGTVAKSLIAMPIVETNFDFRKERVPCGVVIAINKAGGAGFTLEDADNLTHYNVLVIKIFEIMTYIIRPQILGN